MREILQLNCSRSCFFNLLTVEKEQLQGRELTSRGRLTGAVARALRGDATRPENDVRSSDPGGWYVTALSILLVLNVLREMFVHRYISLLV